MCTGPPTREPAPEGPSLIVGSGVKDWNPEESEAGAIAPSPTPPAHTASQFRDVGCPALVNTLGSTPFRNRRAKTKKMTQMKEQIKAPEKIQLNNEEIANISDAQFKTPIIRKLTALVKFGYKLDEKMKAMLSETKENVQGTNSDGKETGTQINAVDQKEERNIQPEKNEETRIQKKWGEA